MKITTLSSRDLNRDTSLAKQAAKSGPVYITDQGCPPHVLLTIEEYRRITGQQANIVDLLAMPGAEEVEFEPSRCEGELWQSVNLA